MTFLWFINHIIPLKPVSYAGPSTRLWGIRGKGLTLRVRDTSLGDGLGYPGCPLLV